MLRNGSAATGHEDKLRTALTLARGREIWTGRQWQCKRKNENSTRPGDLSDLLQADGGQRAAGGAPALKDLNVSANE